jgi:hypothetical protein
MRDTAIGMEATAVPSTPQRRINVRDNEDLVLIDATLEQDTGTAVPRRVFFLEHWRPGVGHYRDGRFYRDRDTAWSICEDYVASLGDGGNRLVRHGRGWYSWVRQSDEREVWNILVVSEPVKDAAVASTEGAAL